MITNANQDFEDWKLHEDCLAREDGPQLVVSRPYQKPTEPVTPTWKLLGKAEPKYARRARLKKKRKRKVKACRKAV